MKKKKFINIFRDFLFHPFPLEIFYLPRKCRVIACRERRQSRSWIFLFDEKEILFAERDQVRQKSKKRPTRINFSAARKKRHWEPCIYKSNIAEKNRVTCVWAFFFASRNERKSPEEWFPWRRICEANLFASLGKLRRTGEKKRGRTRGDFFFLFEILRRTNRRCVSIYPMTARVSYVD